MTLVAEPDVALRRAEYSIGPTRNGPAASVCKALCPSLRGAAHTWGAKISLVLVPSPMGHKLILLVEDEAWTIGSMLAKPSTVCSHSPDMQSAVSVPYRA